jgi:hypothetical protein
MNPDETPVFYAYRDVVEALAALDAVGRASLAALDPARLTRAQLRALRRHRLPRHAGQDVRAWVPVALECLATVAGALDDAALLQRIRWTADAFAQFVRRLPPEPPTAA